MPGEHNTTQPPDTSASKGETVAATSAIGASAAQTVVAGAAPAPVLEGGQTAQAGAGEPPMSSSSAASADAGPASPSRLGGPVSMPALSGGGGERKRHDIELLSDVELNVKIELGRATMLIEEVLKLGEGAVVELDKLAGDPVDVLVNDRLVARGEVLVLNDNFCVRISEIVAGDGVAA